MSKCLFIVDVQNDFVNGSLGCLSPNINGEYSVIKNITKRINDDDIKNVIFSVDWHKFNHPSFKEYGGHWPSHCVMFTSGAAIYGNLVKMAGNKLIDIIYKGINSESYSAYYGDKLFTSFMSLHTLLQDVSSQMVHSNQDIILCGIAGEYCVLETYKDLKKHGFEVVPYWQGIGWVGEENRKLYDIKGE